MFSGCGGGGGGGSTVGSGVAGTVVSGAAAYTARPLATAEVGASETTLSAPGVSLSIILSATRTVSVSERFYFTGMPGGIVGSVFDIKPDGLDLSANPAQLCIGYAGTGFGGAQLQIYTGESLEIPLETTDDAAGSRVCAMLTHTSPYGIRLAQMLPITEYTIFGNLDVKGKYYYKVYTTNGTDSDRGAYVQYRVHVECEMKCMAEGDRFFRFIRGGDYDGELFIRDNGTYQLWRDVSGMKWLRLRSAPGGGIEAGIAYLLAAHFVDYFASGVSGVSDSLLDPPQNLIQRFIDYDTDTTGFTRYVSLKRDGGIVTMRVSNDGSAERSFTVEEATAKITKNYFNLGVPATTTALPSDTSYTAIRDDMLMYLTELIGYDDTPDYTAGDPADEYARLTPNQELFAVNTRNLITGMGWQNIEAIEKYYRDRLRKYQQ